MPDPINDHDGLDASTAQRLRRALGDPPELLTPPAGSWEAIVAAVNTTPPAVSGRAQISRRSGILALVGGIAAGLALGVAGSELLRRDEESVLASAELTPLDQPSVAGTARLFKTAERYRLAVQTANPMANPGGYLEVWLINTDLKRMVTVGVFSPGSSGAFPIDPALIDDGYTIVDLSRERFDDQPAHSGDTVMRGSLKF